MAIGRTLRADRHIGVLEAELGRTDQPTSQDRVRTPRETLARLRPLFPELGITRLGMLTGLDVIGIPVAFATRPNSFTLSVFQGKGLDADAAMVSAAMEAFETRIAELPPAGMEVRSIRQMRSGGRRMIQLDDTARCIPHIVGEEAPLPWCAGLDLMSGAEVAVPWWLVGLDHREPRPAGFEQSSDGLSSGNNPAEATLHGLCELVERDAWTLMRLWHPDRVARARIDPAISDDPVLQTLAARIDRAGMDLHLIDITSDVGVPVLMAVIVPRVLHRLRDHRLADICGGVGCHPVAARAAVKAVVEAAQSRLTAIAGSRDDFSSEIYRNASRAHVDTASVMHLLPIAQAGRTLRSEPVPSTLQGQITWVLSRLASVGIEEVIAVPLGPPSLRLSVVRIIVPGLEVDVDGANIQLGVRAAMAMRAAA